MKWIPSKTFYRCRKRFKFITAQFGFSRNEDFCVKVSRYIYLTKSFKLEILLTQIVCKIKKWTLIVVSSSGTGAEAETAGSISSSHIAAIL